MSCHDLRLFFVNEVSCLRDQVPGDTGPAFDQILTDVLPNPDRVEMVFGTPDQAGWDLK